MSNQPDSYPCAQCGKPRTKAEGGTVFTVCEACWNETATAGPASGESADGYVKVPDSELLHYRLIEKLYVNQTQELRVEKAENADLRQQVETLTADLNAAAEVLMMDNNSRERAIAQAVDAERERCAKAICIYCAEGDPLDGSWHRYPSLQGIRGKCHAAALRAQQADTEGR